MIVFLIWSSISFTTRRSSHWPLRLLIDFSLRLLCLHFLKLWNARSKFFFHCFIICFGIFFSTNLFSGEWKTYRLMELLRKSRYPFILIYLTLSFPLWSIEQKHIERMQLAKQVETSTHVPLLETKAIQSSIDISKVPPTLLDVIPWLRSLFASTISILHENKDLDSFD